MKHNPNDYIIENTNITEITYTDILKHSSEIFDSDTRNYFDIHPTTIEINSGSFSNLYSLTDFPLVSVIQTENSIILSCPCSTSNGKLCNHQVQVLQNIIKQPYLRIFFDPTFRQLKIQQFAKEYGMENEPDLDTYFRIEYVSKSIEIKSKIKELIKINDTSNTYLKDQLLPKRSLTLEGSANKEPSKKTILVLSKHKYYEQLIVELYEGTTTRDGKIKNPILPIDPLNSIWKTTQIEEVKFFTGISNFQNNYTTTKSESELDGLRMIVNNPLLLDVFYLNRDVSENVTASSIVPVELKALETHIKLSVFKKDPFYEVSGELIINGKAYPFKTLNLKFNNFILIGNTLNLIADTDMLRIIVFFKANNQKVIVHASKYEEFRHNILAKLEDQITIDYSYIKLATKKQIEAQNFNQDIEKIIYLSDLESHVSITPVMRYGNMEIPVFSRKQIQDIDPNGNVFKVERDNELEIQFTSILLRQHPDFEDQLDEGMYFYLHKEKFLDENWFLNAFEEWRNQHIRVLGFNDLKKNKLNQHKATVFVRVISGIDWFNTSLIVSFGGQKASLKQLYKAITTKSKFVQLDDGTQGILPLEWMKKIAVYFQTGEIADELIKIPKSSFREIDKLFDDSMLSEETKNELADYAARFANFEGISDVPVPAGLNATLRDYQLQGLKWLNFLDDFNFGACLADDMGLGKTIQIIAFILLQRTKQSQNTNLIVVPTSLLFNWQAEVLKFAPSIQLFTHYGSNRVKDRQEFNPYEIILTTYGMLLSDIRLLKDYRFNYIFLDESQAIKNPESQRYKAVRLLQSRNKVVLTGTPIENNTFDIYGQLSFACPGLLGNKQYFKDIYSTPIDKFENSKRAIELQKKIAPFILRRTKKEVAKELPDKTEMVIYCEMGEEQRKVYDNCETELRDYISAKKEDEIAKNSMHVLTGLTKLRQICNSPALLMNEEHLGDFSSKIETLMEQIENKSPRHKILVFSQFVSMLELIKKELENRDISFEYLTGQTKDRASAVHQFQENHDVRVFLISLKAGGIGLNLTEADYVYLVDPWWNPAVENQAIDRCYRIGQMKNVIAIRLICPNTIEEKIMKLQESKTKLVADLIKTDGSVFKSFSKTDLIAMLT